MMKKTATLCFLIISSLYLQTHVVSAENNKLSVGVLAKRGTDLCLEQWIPTAEYLTVKIPEKSFAIVPLSYDEMYEVVEAGTVDFILVNPSLYVELEIRYGASRIATLKNVCPGGVCTKYGGVIFCKSSRNDINNLDELKGKSIMTLSETSLGGWRAAWRELQEHGIDPYRDCANIRSGATHDTVVYAVMEGLADVGIVRTGILETMVLENKIDPRDFHVIQKHDQKGSIPFLHSTRLYPEWAFAKAKHTTDELAKKVAKTLFEMPIDCTAAISAKCAGWTIPLDYQSVHDCLKKLRLGPYKDLGTISPIDVFRQYWHWVLTTFGLFVVMFVSITIIGKLNRAIKNSNIKLQHEVRERTQTEKSLRESERRFRQLVENSPVGISIIKNGQIIYRNPEHEKIIGPAFRPSSFLNFENIYQEDIEKVKQCYRDVQSGRKSKLDSSFRLYPFAKKGPGGQIKWVQCRANLIQYEGDKAILLNIRDITKTRELEHIVIMQDKMNSLGCVAAGIAHEIRNPLTGINTYLYTLEEIFNSATLEQEDFEMIRHILGKLKVASDKMESVIKRVMDFSKPSAPEMVLTDINQCLHEVINLSSVSLRKAMITVEESLSQTLPQCYANPNLIEQMTLNLINNAAKAMEDFRGIKKIKITSFRKNGSIVVGISDSGPGVPFEIRDKIFDPFFSGKNGMGIGLSIVQRIIADHGGELYIDTSEWGGAEFRIELPIQKSDKAR